MAIKPIVRYMLLCDDYFIDTENENRITIVGLINSIRSVDYIPYPILHESLCVFLTLTEGRGKAEVQIIGIFEETGEKVFASNKHTVQLPNDPLQTVSIPFRILNIPFPQSGQYSVQFWYDGEMIKERPLLMR